MSRYDLISAEDYGNLSDDPAACFVEIGAICQRNMTRIIDNEESGGDVNRSVMTTYMSIIASAAVECGVGRFNFDPSGDIWREYAAFSLAVQGAVAKIRIRHRGARNPYSVQLTARARNAIEIQIIKLRESIDSTIIDGDRKAALNKKLDELLGELRSESRFNFAKAMSTLAFATAAIAGVTTIAADGPQAIHNILRLIGLEKQTEEEAVQRLAPPLKLITAQNLDNKKPNDVSAKKSSNYAEIDDDIPF